MKKAELTRRIFHMTAVVYLVYYLLPDELFPEFYKWYGVIIILFITLMVEAVRLKTGKIFFGLRDYEEKRISAFAWFAIGMTIALLLFEMVYVVSVIIGMAFIDPLIGEIKRKNERFYPVLPIVIYGIIMLSCLLILSEMKIGFLILLTFVATFFAIVAERWDIKYIDDDFLMIVIPLLALTGLDYLFSLL